MKSKIIKYGEIIRYLIIGILTTLVSLIIYYVLTLTILNSKVSIQLQIANIISWIGAVTFAYYANKYYVFKIFNNNKKNIILFYLSRIITLMLDMFLMYLLVTKLSYDDKIIKPIIQLIIIIGNYMLSKFFVFNRKNKD